jgi:hypothetical protein
MMKDVGVEMRRRKVGDVLRIVAIIRDNDEAIRTINRNRKMRMRMRDVMFEGFNMFRRLLLEDVSPYL